MRVIPVIDLKGGLAVHAVAGDRAHYRPARGVLHRGSDPIGLARAYRDVLGRRELYVADLDAIAGAPPALAVYRALADLGLALWVDAGVRDGGTVGRLLGAGASGLVLGLETLGGPATLAAIVAEAGADRLVFGLDLRDGRPVIAPGAEWGTDDPGGVAGRALEAGVRRVLVLDLARVGTGRGVGLGPAEALSVAHPGAEVWAGGGVAGPEDLPRLAGAGVAAALVGAALRDGRIGKSDL